MARSRWTGAVARVAVAGTAGVALSVVAFGGTAHAAGGVLDTSYGSGGFALASSPGTYSGARAVAIDGEGRVVAAGFAHVDGTIAQGVMVARFLTNGSPDTTFGNGGVVVTDLPDRFDEASAVAIAPDGKIVVAGRSGDDAFVARYDMGGRLDPSFGGVRLLDTGGEEAAFAVAVTDNGKVVVGGRAY